MKVKRIRVIMISVGIIAIIVVILNIVSVKKSEERLFNLVREQNLDDIEKNNDEMVDIDALIDDNLITSLTLMDDNSITKPIFINGSPSNKIIKYKNKEVYREIKEEYRDQFYSFFVRETDSLDTTAIIENLHGKDVDGVIYNGVVYIFSKEKNELITYNLDTNELNKVDIPETFENINLYDMKVFKGIVYFEFSFRNDEFNIEDGSIIYNIEKNQWKKIITREYERGIIWSGIDKCYYNNGIIYFEDNKLMFFDFDGNQKILYTTKFNYPRYTMEVVSGNTIRINSELHATEGKGGMDVIKEIESLKITLDENGNIINVE